MKNTTLLSGLIFLLVLIATATGIFYQTPGSPIEYTTVRGEQVIFRGSGLYRYDPTSLAREGVVWDVINLLIGLPLFAVAIYLNQRNSLRGRLLLGGLLFYFFYVYVLAMTGYSFNRLFLVYVAIFALSAVAFFVNLHGVNVARLPAQISSRFPHRLFVGFAFIMGALLVSLWLGRIIPIMVNDRFPPDMAGMTTLVSQGFDLGMIVPLLVSAGILLWRRSPWGYLLTSISLSYALLMCIALPAWIAVPLIQDGKLNLIEAGPFLLLCLVGLALAGMFYRNLKEEKSL
ncbi:MAG: hypothetical protein HY326_10570 [Chloroflexi bacterium]|nr:hypothetical protein [Chloroflexota bacterium]